MRLPPYPKYKPSRIGWLDDVPAHWAIGKFSRELKIAEGQADPELEPYRSMILVAPNHIESGTGRLLAQETAESQGAISGKYICRSGEVIYSKIRPALAKAVLAPEDCLCSADMYPMTPRGRLRSRYLLRLLLSSPFTAWSILESDRVAMPKLNRETLGSLYLPIPPASEQTSIADFLDRETAKIDTLVAKKRMLIERMKEKRTALISRTVTRGLPPAAARAAGLAPHPELKPSGIDWLGDVPEHWEVKALKWESPVLRGASPRPIDNEVYFDDEGEYAWVRIADVSAAGMYLQETPQRLSPLGQSLSVPLHPGTLFLSIAGSVGKPCITEIKCCIHDGFVYFPFWRGESRFLYYLFASGEPYKGLGKLGTQLNLNTDTVGSIVVGLPRRPEQRAVAEYLDRETAKLDAMATRVGTAIERLQEYRAALITAAVTGKIDVREGAVR